MSSEFIKPDGQDGLFSFVSLGTDLDSTSAAYTGGFAKITKVGAASAFDAMKDDAIEDGEAVGVGDIIHLAAWADVGSNPLSEGDECTPLVIDTDDSSWVTDRGRSMSRDLQDKTTQGDVRAGRRAYGLGPLQNETGSISGLYAIGSVIQRDIDSHFTKRVVDDGTKKTRVPIKSTSYLTALCYRETTVAGEVEIWVFREMWIQSVDDTGLPLNGNVPFNFAYTTQWKQQYERTIAA
ncbi:MAG: hypothetical protein ACPKOP_04050 [Sphaerochaetaceae bacterium]